MSRHLITTLLLGSALMSGACATTAKGAKSSALANDYAAQTYRSEAPQGTTLAVVRYPAFVDPDARDLYHDAFKNSPIDGSLSRKSGMESEALADSVILKSNYFALSLFKELAAKLPEHSVLLSPHIIKKGADGKLYSEAMTQAESLPSVVTVDFAAYTFPDATKMMGILLRILIKTHPSILRKNRSAIAAIALPPVSTRLRKSNWTRAH